MDFAFRGVFFRRRFSGRLQERPDAEIADGRRDGDRHRRLTRRRPPAAAVPPGENSINWNNKTTAKMDNMDASSG